MDRKEFLHTGCRCGLSAAAMAFLAPALVAEAASATDPQQVSQAEAMHAWLVDMLAAVDTQLDPAARVRLLQACGRAEARRTSFDAARQANGDLERFLATWRRWLGEANVRSADGRVELFADHCSCPLVGSAPERLSDTWCECARGWMTEMFGTALGRPVPVELVESIKRGGRRCHWVIRV